MPRTNALIVAVLCLACVCGCEPWPKKTVKPTPTLTTVPIVLVPLARRDTIGEFATLSGALNAKVSGYGLVIGLGNRGCTSVPPTVENYLKNEIARYGVGWYSTGTGNLSPERIIRDKDTAVVLVAGMIPALAPVGTRFDLYVTALPGTETTTLDSGHLMDSRLFLTLDEIAMPSGGTQAIARSDPYLGDVMVNPFLDPAKGDDQLKFRNGRIPNGGVVTRDMPVRLELREANYGTAAAIAAAINAKFKEGFKPVAQAQDSRIVNLRIPYRYREDYLHYLELILHIPMRTGTGVWEAHAKALVKGMEAPGADYVNLALVLEAMGPQMLPIIKEGYTSRNEAAALYCAIAGMRLDDTKALDVIVYQATKRNSPLRMAAIRELSRCPREIDARRTLEALLDDGDDTIRIAAYEALEKIGHSLRVKRVPITNNEGRPLFSVDLVQTKGNYMIYATQTGEPRMALFADTQKTYLARVNELISKGTVKTISQAAAWIEKNEPSLYAEEVSIPIGKDIAFHAPDDLVWIQTKVDREGVVLPILGVNDPTVRTTRMTMTTRPATTPAATMPAVTTQPATGPTRARLIGPTLMVNRLVYRTARHSDDYEVPAQVKGLIEALGTPPDKDAYGQIRGLGLTYGQVIEVLYGMCKQGSIQAKFVLQDLPEIQRITDNASTTERPDMPGQ